MNTQSIIDRYVDKTLSFGCRFKYKQEWDDDVLIFTCSYCDTGNTTTVHHLWKKDSTSEIEDFKIENCKILGHPVLISDIIFKLQQAQVMKLVRLWRPFENKSLQEIALDVEGRPRCRTCKGIDADLTFDKRCECPDYQKDINYKQLSKPAQDLFDFLDNITTE